MNLKQYTDENYIPLSDLQFLDKESVDRTIRYRREFLQIIPLDEITYVNIVETPTLIKKRYSKNVELKGRIDIEAEDNDYILEIAKDMVNGTGKEIKLLEEEKNKLLEKYKNNNNDLTIITSYIIRNIPKIINLQDQNKIQNLIPELNDNDSIFLKNANNINMYYSIKDYQDITSCSYETGRKSLDKLVELELFKKRKVGKKFVYKPTTEITITNIKGGS